TECRPAHSGTDHDRIPMTCFHYSFAFASRRPVHGAGAPRRKTYCQESLREVEGRDTGRCRDAGAGRRERFVDYGVARDSWLADRPRAASTPHCRISLQSQAARTAARGRLQPNGLFFRACFHWAHSLLTRNARHRSSRCVPRIEPKRRMEMYRKSILTACVALALGLAGAAAHATVAGVPFAFDPT